MYCSTKLYGHVKLPLIVFSYTIMRVILFLYKFPILQFALLNIKEFIKKLIAVTSCLVAGINTLCAMVNQCYAAFKLMPWIKYMGYANFANNIGKAIIFHVSWHLSKANRTY